MTGCRWGPSLNCGGLNSEAVPTVRRSFGTRAAVPETVAGNGRRADTAPGICGGQVPPVAFSLVDFSLALAVMLAPSPLPCLIATLRGLACSATGMVRVRTPSR